MYETLNAPELQDDFAASGPDTSSVSDYETGGEYAGYEEASDPGIDNLGFSAGVANSGHGGRSGETAAADNDPGEYDAGLRADEGWEDVPFHNHPRWKELIAQKQAMARELAGLAGFAPVIQRLKTMGFDSAQAVEAALAAEEQKLFEAKLAQSLNVSVQGGRIDPATAQAQYRAAVAERQNQQMAKSLAEYDVSQRIAAAKERYPEMDEEMVRSIGLAYHGRADFDIHEIARRSHERNISYLERHLASYEAHRAEERAAPLSAENGRMAIAGNSKGVLRRSWEELLGLTKTSI